MKKRVDPSREQAREIRRVKGRLLPLPPARTRVDVETWGGGTGICGVCWQTGPRRWSIRVNAELDAIGFTDTLIHEFAHALSGPGNEPEGVHGPVWGVCFALCYRAVNERSVRVNKRRA